MIAALAVIVGAVLFGAAGRLGTIVADACYGGIERAPDGPPAGAVPAWIFVAAPAALGACVALHADSALTVAVLLVAVLALTVCAQTDVRSGFIPDAFSLGPLVVVLAVAALRHEWEPLWGALFVLVPFGALAAISRGRGMGWGDVKLAVLGGALAGMGGITVAVAVASFAAWIVHASGRRDRQPIAFGPYLVAAIGGSLALGTAF